MKADFGFRESFQREKEREKEWEALACAAESQLNEPVGPWPAVVSPILYSGRGSAFHSMKILMTTGRSQSQPASQGSCLAGSCLLILSCFLLKPKMAVNCQLGKGLLDLQAPSSSWQFGPWQNNSIPSTSDSPCCQ